MKGTSKLIFWVCLIVTIALLVASFIAPPLGIIDNSVLAGVGVLFGFATLGQLPDLIHDRSVELHHGQTEIVVKQNDSDS